MLSISPIKTAGGLASYYEKESGEKNYWQKEADEATGWYGKGAAALGLAGSVDPEQFQTLMEGQLPDGSKLPTGPTGERRPGYDLTFSAAKSVSMAALIGHDERVLAAHDQAVREALNYLERETSQTRIRQEDGGVKMEKTGNLTAAVFRHEMSRNHDPQLHSHAVLANVTMDKDGQWRALSSEQIFRHKMAAGAVYRAELGSRMRELGYALRQTKDGFELKNISGEQIRAFSSRREEIVQQMQENGTEGARAAELAALQTRAAKTVLNEEGHDMQSEAWSHTAEASGLTGSASIDAQVADARSMSVEHEQADNNVTHDSVSFALEHLSERQSMMQHHEVIRYAASQGAALGVRLSDIERDIDRRVNNRELIVADGRLTTTEALKRENEIVRMMRSGKGVTAAIQADSGRVSEISDGLTSGQADAVRLALTSRDRFSGIEGKAGTGKTTMLSRVVSEAQEQGYEVKGLAPSAQAAHVLENETGAKSETLAKHILARQAGSPSEKPQLWVVDETGMMSARQAHQLMRKAQAEHAKVIMVGDRQQLSSIEAGKPFAVLQNKGMETARMDQIMRQRNEQLKLAVEKIVRHNGKGAIHDLSDSIHQIENRDERLKLVANKYLETPRNERSNTLVITETNHDRAYLSTKIRKGLQAEGMLAGEEIKAQQLVKVGLTRAQMKQAHSYEAGQMVRFGRNYKSIGVSKGETLEVAGIDTHRGIVQMKRDGQTVEWDPAKLRRAEVYEARQSKLQAGDQIRFTRNEYDLDRVNGHTAQVLSVNAQDRTVAIQMADGREQSLNLDDKQQQTWTHGYVSTVYSAQGATANKAILALNAEQGMGSEQSIYVGISRARDGVEIVVDNQEKLGQVAEQQRGQDSALEGIENSGQHPEGVLEQEYHSAQGQNIHEILEKNLGEQQEQETGMEMEQ